MTVQTDALAYINDPARSLDQGQKDKLVCAMAARGFFTKSEDEARQILYQFLSGTSFLRAICSGGADRAIKALGLAPPPPPFSIKVGQVLSAAEIREHGATFPLGLVLTRETNNDKTDHHGPVYHAVLTAKGFSIAQKAGQIYTQSRSFSDKFTDWTVTYLPPPKFHVG